jgi:hypothetical protein
MADFQKQRNQKYEMGLAKDPTKNEVDFDEKDATNMADLTTKTQSKCKSCRQLLFGLMLSS